MLKNRRMEALLTPQDTVGRGKKDLETSAIVKLANIWSSRKKPAPTTPKKK